MILIRFMVHKKPGLYWRKVYGANFVVRLAPTAECEV